MSEAQQSSLHQRLHQLLNFNEGTHLKTSILPTADVEDFLALSPPYCFGEDLNEETVVPEMCKEVSNQ